MGFSFASFGSIMMVDNIGIGESLKVIIFQVILADHLVARFYNTGVYVVSSGVVLFFGCANLKNVCLFTYKIFSNVISFPLSISHFLTVFQRPKMPPPLRSS